MSDTSLLLCQPPTGLASTACLDWIERALATPVDTLHKLAIFPELFLSGYATSVADPARAVLHDREQLPIVQQLCHRHGAWCVVGLATEDDEGHRNSAACIDSAGRIQAIHHKCRPFGEAEAAAFASGQTPPLFDTPLGRTSMAICFDIEDPALIAGYQTRGVDWILTPTANMLPYTLVPKVKVRARALDNSLWIAYSNYTGCDAEHDFPGDSIVVDPRGVVQGNLGQLSGTLVLRIPGS